MFTRDSALEYSNTIIHKLVGECARTGLTRKELCNLLNLSNEALAMWITGSRPCQQFWIVRNAELLLEILEVTEDSYYIKRKANI